MLSYMLCPIPVGALSPVIGVERIPASAGELAAIGGWIALRDGRQIYFGQREAGEVRMRSDGGDTDAEAVAVVASPSDRITHILLANGTEVRTAGRNLKVGDRI